jgi:hypothetical protein
VSLGESSESILLESARTVRAIFEYFAERDVTISSFFRGIRFIPFIVSFSSLMACEREKERNFHRELVSLHNEAFSRGVNYETCMQWILEGCAVIEILYSLKCSFSDTHNAHACIIRNIFTTH